jgi:predicted phage terminase large subunit-like protein
MTGHGWTEAKMSSEGLHALASLSREKIVGLYADVLQSENNTENLRFLCRKDLFFLLVVGCRRADLNCPWMFERCREVEANPNGHLDLWAREHGKSSIITFGKTIQDILVNPNVTVGIFSHTRPIAKSFLKQIKTELEENQFLKSLFPEILYANPQKESVLWSLDAGITVKRTSNPKEATVEAYGLVDGQPTSKHFSLLVYDDVVTRESVSTPEMMEKTTEAWGLSLSLGAIGGKRRIIGTRYHFNDTYKHIIDRGAAIPRIKAATVDGTPQGASVYMDKETLAERRMGGPYVFACQYLQNPVADGAQGFKVEWLKYYDGEYGKFGGPPGSMNIFLLVDPASKKKKENDYTAMAVIGLGADQNYYLLDAIRDRLNLTERTKEVFRLVRKWRPLAVGYEQYGMQSDIEHIQFEQNLRRERFKIVELGGPMPKEDRIRRMIPVFENGRFYLPRKLMFRDYEGKARDYVAEFLRDEYSAFPVATHDDMFDNLARIAEPQLGASFPTPKGSVTGSVPTKANNAYKVL